MTHRDQPTKEAVGSFSPVRVLDLDPPAQCIADVWFSASSAASPQDAIGRDEIDHRGRLTGGTMNFD
jgi:hypothetical protein